MNSATNHQIAESILAMHRATARFVGVERVREHFEGEAVWEGEVLVFQLSGHPTASRCFAWEVDGEITAVLAEGPVKTAVDAVRVSILADGTVEPEA